MAPPGLQSLTPEQHLAPALCPGSVLFAWCEAPGWGWGNGVEFRVMAGTTEYAKTRRLLRVLPSLSKSDLPKSISHVAHTQ